MKNLLLKTHRRPQNFSWLNISAASLVAAGVFSAAYFGGPVFRPLSYEADSGVSLSLLPPVKHVATPEPFKAIYMSECAVGTQSFRDSLGKLLDETELNAVVIDIKDYSGKLSFRPEDTTLADSVSTQCGTKDIKSYIRELHDKNIYVVGRITVFQDPYYTKIHPELAVKKASDQTVVWNDYKGLAFIDVGAKPYWDYIVKISKASYEVGFDELNFDYIRFPSDGNMKDVSYTWSVGMSKADALKNFFQYLSSSLQGTGVKISADLFGMTTTNTDDLNIGQVLENALQYFDYVLPMVYPSHYPPTFHGFKNPADHPYEVVNFSMSEAVRRVTEASTTPFFRGGMIHTLQLRPWLQDFNLGATYTAPLVRAQMQATYDAGLTSWALWNASNRYTKDALLPQ